MSSNSSKKGYTPVQLDEGDNYSRYDEVNIYIFVLDCRRPLINLFVIFFFLLSMSSLRIQIPTSHSIWLSNSAILFRQMYYLFVLFNHAAFFRREYINIYKFQSIIQIVYMFRIMLSLFCRRQGRIKYIPCCFAAVSFPFGRSVNYSFTFILTFLSLLCILLLSKYLQSC